MPPTPPLIALSGATAGFGGRPLFEGIDVALSAGDRACLVGRNGSGKSTLMKLLAGDIAPDRSEEHTSELQSLMRISYAVFCLKKKNNKLKNQKRQTIQKKLQ